MTGGGSSIFFPHGKDVDRRKGRALPLFAPAVKKQGRSMTPAPWTALALTLYPEMFPGPLGVSLAGRALNDGVWSLSAIDIRDFAADKHRSVDDTPAGGGPGMVMRADVTAAAIDFARQRLPNAPLACLSPRGTPLTHARVLALSQGPGVILLCGRFEGIDERVLAARNVEEISIGDYVLSGGELAAMVLIDAAVRLIPGVIGEQESLADESFAHGLLEYPQYTRPRVWEGREIPEVLLSGDHGRIARWRREQSEALTQARRPDLWLKHSQNVNPRRT
jgi:tRNA (guanine37-N1)-methyltransferase